MFLMVLVVFATVLNDLWQGCPLVGEVVNDLKASIWRTEKGGLYSNVLLPKGFPIPKVSRSG